MMEWTDKKPTQPGWYWYKRWDNDYPTPLQVRWFSGDDATFLVVWIAVDDEKCQYQLSQYGGQWAGPLSPPP